MTSSVHPAIEFDAALHVGQIVEARFTNNNRALRFRARILKLNDRTARVEALEHGVNGWDAGHVFVIQRFSSKTWSHNNGLYPVSVEAEKTQPRIIVSGGGGGPTLGSNGGPGMSMIDKDYL